MLLDQVDPVLDVWEVKHGQRDRGNGQRDEEIAQGGANPSMVYVVPGLVRAAHAGDLTRDELRDNAIAALFGNVSAGPTLAKVCGCGLCGWVCGGVLLCCTCVT